MATIALAVHCWLVSLWGYEDGQGLVEYALVLVLASIVAVAAVTNLGQTIVSRLYNLTNTL